ncbi:conjugative transposon TraN protein [Pedobacter africanus]|uniref:conjugative transposon protein TraN n=1 Tax=Pedobacter africanus TaxID=151894 RepID=UPI00339842D4
MRKRSERLITCMLMLLLSVRLNAQVTVLPGSSIEPVRITVSKNKTANLIFPYSIISVDRGHRDLLVQKAIGVENILQVKAASDSLPETNISVVTADGSFFSLLARFAKDHPILNFYMGLLSKSGNRAVGVLPNSSLNEAVVRNVAEAISVRKPFLKRPLDRRENIMVGLQGLYIKNDMFYWQLVLDNSSNVGYDIGQFRFFIRDQKKVKRTASQELEISHSYVSGDIQGIAQKSRKTVVFAFPKFTIPDGKYLTVQLMERNGGRHLTFKIPNGVLLKAREF